MKVSSSGRNQVFELKMKTVKVAILTIFILCFQEVKSEETISEPQLNETRPQQCKQQIKCHFLHLMNEYFNEVREIWK